MIGSELSASAKLTDIWIINTNATAHIVDLIFDLIWLVLVFYSKFFYLELFFYIAWFLIFFKRIYESNIWANNMWDF